MFNGLERLWKEAVVVRFEELLEISLERLRNMRKVPQTS
jgi:hypothetical protein